MPEPSPVPSWAGWRPGGGAIGRSRLLRPPRAGPLLRLRDLGGCHHPGQAIQTTLRTWNFRDRKHSKFRSCDDLIASLTYDPASGEPAASEPDFGGDEGGGGGIGHCFTRTA